MMEAPVYKLEQVVHNKDGREDFEGPLDLILFLLSKNKIEIQDIPIALILEQYLAYLEQRQQMDLEVASDFVAMAAQLMFIKTRMLLSLEDEEAKSEMEELIRSLEERRRSEDYARIKTVLERMGALEAQGRDLFVKGPEPLDQGGPPLYDHEAADLLNALRDISVRSERRLPPPLSSFGEIVRQEHYPVSQKAWDILERLKLGVTSFRLLFWGSRSRSEVVAVFLAVLELCKARVVRLAGGEKDWTVTPTGESAEGLKL